MDEKMKTHYLVEPEKILICGSFEELHWGKFLGSGLDAIVYEVFLRDSRVVREPCNEKAENPSRSYAAKVFFDRSTEISYHQPGQRNYARLQGYVEAQMCARYAAYRVPAILDSCLPKDPSHAPSCVPWKDKSPFVAVVMDLITPSVNLDTRFSGKAFESPDQELKFLVDLLCSLVVQLKHLENHQALHHDVSPSNILMMTTTTSPLPFVLIDWIRTSWRLTDTSKLDFGKIRPLSFFSDRHRGLLHLNSQTTWQRRLTKTSTPRFPLKLEGEPGHHGICNEGIMSLLRETLCPLLRSPSPSFPLSFFQNHRHFIIQDCPTLLQPVVSQVEPQDWSAQSLLDGMMSHFILHQWRQVGLLFQLYSVSICPHLGKWLNEHFHLRHFVVNPSSSVKTSLPDSWCSLQTSATLGLSAHLNPSWCLLLRCIQFITCEIPSILWSSPLSPHHDFAFSLFNLIVHDLEVSHQKVEESLFHPILDPHFRVKPPPQ